MWFSIFLLLIGIVILLKGASYLVDGSSSLAKKLGISSLVIGLTVVSFGTSSPELLVNIVSSFSGNNDLAISNVIGSNISNIMLIGGISAIVFPLTIKHGTVWKEIPLSFLAVILLALMANDAYFEGDVNSYISRVEGLTLCSFFIIFLYYSFGVNKVEGSISEVNEYSTAKSSLMFFIGILGLFFGAKLTVDSAVSLASIWGLSEALIGLTIVAVGTSLPELAASAMAAYKGKPDIAVGNIVGSNIFNIFFVLGISTSIRSIPYNQALNFDLTALVMATFILFFFVLIGKRGILGKVEGIGLLMCYIIYIGYIVNRG